MAFTVKAAVCTGEGATRGLALWPAPPEHWVDVMKGSEQKVSSAGRHTGRRRAPHPARSGQRGNFQQPRLRSHARRLREMSTARKYLYAFADIQRFAVLSWARPHELWPVESVPPTTLGALAENVQMCMCARVSTRRTVSPLSGRPPLITTADSLNVERCFSRPRIFPLSTVPSGLVGVVVYGNGIEGPPSVSLILQLLESPKPFKD